MMFIDLMSAPIMLFHASMAATKLADLRCHHLRTLATTLSRQKTEPAELHFLFPINDNHFLVGIISDGIMATAR